MKGFLWRGVWVGAVAATLLFCASTVGAQPRAGIFALSGSWSRAWISPDELNRNLGFDNLSFAVSVPEFGTYRQIAGDLRYGVSERFAVELQTGYWWIENSEGRVSRKLRAIPVLGNLVYFLHVAKGRSLSVVAGGGAFLDTQYSGNDPLGGFDQSKTALVVQGGLEVEQFVSDRWSGRIRGTRQWAGASDYFPDGGDLDLSGWEVQLGLRVYFRPSTPKETEETDG